MLDPLTDVGIRMFMTIRIGSSQFVVNVLSNGEWREPEDDADHPHRDPGIEQRREISQLSQKHGRRIGIHGSELQEPPKSISSCQELAPSVAGYGLFRRDSLEYSPFQIRAVGTV